MQGGASWDGRWTYQTYGPWRYSAAFSTVVGVGVGAGIPVCCIRAAGLIMVTQDSVTVWAHRSKSSYSGHLSLPLQQRPSLYEVRCKELHP